MKVELTAGQLIEQLQKFDPNAVYAWEYDGRYKTNVKMKVGVVLEVKISGLKKVIQVFCEASETDRIKAIKKELPNYFERPAFTVDE